MAGLGFFAGGLADSLNQGLNRNQQAQYQQQELQLQQQGQQMAQQRFDMARIDKTISDAADLLQQTIDAGKVAGEDPKTIMSAIGGMYDQYDKLATAAGRGKGFASSQLATWMAAPPSTQIERAHQEAKTPPKVEKIQSAAGDQSLVLVDPYKGTASPVAGGSTEPPDMVNLHGDELVSSLAKRTGNTPDQLRVMATALNDGNVGILTNIGTGKQKGETVKAIRAIAVDQLIHDQGMTPTQAAEYINGNIIDFQATKTGALSLARREANLVGAATTAMATAPRVLEASKAVSKTDYPSLNAIILAAKQGSGDENVIRLGIAVNTFANNYARAIGAGNAAVTNSAREEAFSLLDKAWSQGQIAAAVDQMLNKELPSEVAGANKGLRDYIRNRTGVNPTGVRPTGQTGESGKDQSKPPQYKFNRETGELE